MQIKSINVENFKALRASGTVRLKPLSVIIGNNGSGKSSLMEAVETYARVLTTGVDTAMEHWQGFEHIRHQAAKMARSSDAGLAKQPNAMRFALDIKTREATAKLSIAINTANNGNFLYVQQEQGAIGTTSFERNAVGKRANQSLGLVSSVDLRASLEVALKSVGSGDAVLPYQATATGP